MTTKRDHLSKAEIITVAAIEQGAPTLVQARALVDRFQAMIRQKAKSDLEPWITGHIVCYRNQTTQVLPTEQAGKA